MSNENNNSEIKKGGCDCNNDDKKVGGKMRRHKSRSGKPKSRGKSSRNKSRRRSRRRR